jgi:hypothetical protein
MPEKPEKRKYVQQVGAIRHSREAQRLCIDDVLAFLTGRERHRLLHRMQALGVMALNRAIERKPYQAWKDERGRASHTPYIDNPDEFIAIVKACFCTSTLLCTSRGDNKVNGARCGLGSTSCTGRFVKPLAPCGGLNIVSKTISHCC